MSSENQQPQSQSKNKSEEDELPVPWQKIQGAIWLIGLAILAWQGWWWPGILVLVALSGLFQGAVQLYLARTSQQANVQDEEKNLAQERAAWLPATCPKCGAPLSVTTVRWTGPKTGDCPYCNANLKP
jgi:hypothetical protein